MADCFCGCGRKIRFGSRGVNKQGRRTVGLLTKLREAHERVVNQRESITDPKAPEALFGIAAAMGKVEETDADSLIRSVEDAYAELVTQGEDFKEFWRSVVHDDGGKGIPPALHYAPAREIKKDWEAWGKLGMHAARAAGVPFSRLGVFTGRV
jgi:hypothetical protein